MEQLGPCAECSELLEELAHTHQINRLNKIDPLPNHTLNYNCSKGDVYQVTPLNTYYEIGCGDDIIANVWEELKKTQSVLDDLNNSLYNISNKLKLASGRASSNTFSKSISQESLTSFKVRKLLTSKGQTKIPAMKSPQTSLENLVSYTPSPRKYGISVSLSKLKAKKNQSGGLSGPLNVPPPPAYLDN